MDSKRTIEVRVREVSPFLESYAELERHLANARELRARATAQILTAAGRGMALPFRALGARVAGWQQQRATREALSGCSDRVLADIGIARDDIPLLARGVDPRAESGVTPWWHGWRELPARIAAARRERRHWRRVRRELMAYDDRELDEIGIRRADIPVIARGRALAPAGE